MASAEDIKTYEDLIQHLASLPEADAANQIKIAATILNGSHPGDVAHIGTVDQLNKDIVSYQKIYGFDQEAGVYAQSGITETIPVDERGADVGKYFHLQQQTPFPKDWGALFSYADINFDNKGNVVSGGAGAHYVGNPGTFNGYDYVAIADGHVTVPKDGELTGKNASFLVGGILKDHDDPRAINHTVATIVDGAGELTGYYRQSKTLYQSGTKNDAVTLTGFQTNTYNLSKGELNVGAGVRADLNLNDTNALVLRASANVKDPLTNHPTPTAQIDGAFLWGGTAKPESKIDFSRGAEKAASNFTHENLDRGLVEARKVYATLPEESQNKLVHDISEHMVRADMFNSREDAVNYVQQQLSVQNDPGQSPG